MQVRIEYFKDKVTRKDEGPKFVPRCIFEQTCSHLQLRISLKTSEKPLWKIIYNNSNIKSFLMLKMQFVKFNIENTYDKWNINIHN